MKQARRVLGVTLLVAAYAPLHRLLDPARTSWTLPDTAYSLISDLVSRIRDMTSTVKNLTLMEIQGRVASVLQSYGAPSAAISTAAYGETRPVASNDTDAGRRLNRRVELVVNK